MDIDAHVARLAEQMICGTPDPDFGPWALAITDLLLMLQDTGESLTLFDFGEIGRLGVMIERETTGLVVYTNFEYPELPGVLAPAIVAETQYSGFVRSGIGVVLFRFGVPDALTVLRLALSDIPWFRDSDFTDTLLTLKTE